MLRDDGALFEVFIEDLYEQLSYCDACLLGLSRNSEDYDSMNSLFRVFHSLKGLFYTMEYPALGDYFHRLENHVLMQKNSHKPVEQSFLNLVFSFKEGLANYVAILQTDKSFTFDLLNFQIRLLEIVDASGEENLEMPMMAEEAIPPRKLLYDALKKTELVYLQMIDSDRKIIDPVLLKNSFEQCLQLSEPLDEKRLVSLFRSACRFLDYYVQKKANLDHLAEGLIMETFDWAMKLIDLTKQLTHDDERNFMVHLDMMQAQRIMYLQQLSEDVYQDANENTQKLGEILVRQGKIKEDAIEAVLNKQKNSGIGLKLGEALVSENMLRVKDIAGALQVQNQIRKQSDNYTFIRIPERKVDVLVDGMEELMIMQTQLKEKLRKRWLEGDLGTKLQLDRIDRMLILLQHQAVSFRLQNLDTTLKKAEIIGRSAAKDLGKDVMFKLEGNEIEVSRSILERLQNPILHLIRNAVYHGIEYSEERIQQGKSEQGLLKILGQIDPKYLTITISDDGKGLDLELILSKAIALGIADSKKQYAPWEIIDFIFEPGFSTLDEADTVSGRGLGMNIVETEIKALGGHIEIQNRPTEGVAFMLKVPLHTQNLLGMLVGVAEEKLIVPTANILDILKGAAVEWVSKNNVYEKIVLDDEILDLIPIHSVLELSDESQRLQEGELIILQFEGIKKALPITKSYKEVGVFVNPIDYSKDNKGIFQGVAVINDQEFALIIDVGKIFSI